jgi:hypothetical protein
MYNQEPFKFLYLYCIVSIILIILFIFTPLNSIQTLSIVFKIFIVFILIYCIYLNYLQIKELHSSKENYNKSLYSQYFNANILLSYIFSIFLFVLLFFIIKNHF